MQTALWQILLPRIKRHEGLSLFVYQDTQGHDTLGYGHLLAHGITPAAAEFILHEDISSAYQQARMVRGFDGLNVARQAVIVEMVFNLGYKRLKTFRKMLTALAEKDYQRAAREMLHSRWAEQVGYRAQELAEQMEKGE